MFAKATKKSVAPKVAIQGVSGAGKTFSALRFARGLGERVALIDTENRSASLYASAFDFDACEIMPRPFGNSTAFWWTDFRDAIQAAIDAKYDVLIVDSASHIWDATLAFKSRLDTQGGNSYANWSVPSQTFATVQNAILQAPIPVVCTFRSKMEYALENVDGKLIPRKVGLAPVTRADAEYDFTLVFDIDRDHVATVSKSRAAIFGDDFKEILTEEHGKRFKEWLK